MKTENRTDRILIILALVILLLSSGLFYFDNWMWGGRSDRGEKIGYLTSKTGDVRMKFEGDLKWQKAAHGQDLVYNDAVYSGAGSQAELSLGQSQMTVNENTLIVLRRENDVNFLNLNYGTLFGKLGKGEKLVIETPDGKSVRLETDKATQIVLRKTGKGTKLDVTQGDAKVLMDGKWVNLNKSSRLNVGQGEAQASRLRLLKPLRDQVSYSEEPTALEFAWAWDGNRQTKPDERFVLEFSGQPTFDKIHFSKTVQGQTNTQISVSQSLSMFYRVKGPIGEVSPIEKVNFVRLRKPVIVKPLANQRVQTPPGTNAAVEVEIKKPQGASIWYQVATDREFTRVVANQNTPDERSLRELPIGEYYLRARSDFGNGRVTGWTEPRLFSVEPKLTVMPLANASTPKRLVIPNRSYPSELYKAQPETVQEHLAEQGFGGGFFPLSPEMFDQINLEFDGGREAQTLTDRAWPRLIPGRYNYRYRAFKSGFEPSDWSAQSKLDVMVAPPRPAGLPQYGPVNEMDEAPVSFRFTPLLFARSYDIEVADNPGFQGAREFKSEKPRLSTQIAAGQEHYWRARARDEKGRIISEFSPAYTLKGVPKPVPQMLAKEEPKRRKPAQEEPQPESTVSTRTERVQEEPWQKSGWWAWLGAGYNYIDYRQSLPSRATLNADTAGLSQYFEGGYLSGNGLGSVLTYKNTPGNLRFDNATIDQSRFSWTTVSLEGVMRRKSPFTLLNRPVIYGLRAGAQLHKTPFVHIDANADPRMRSNEMTTASFGVLAEMTRRKWTYYWLMRYQFPISTQASAGDSFSITPTFAFDGSIGTSYNFTKQLKAGLFWYGQWHQYDFIYADADIANAGFQSLFYSTVDVRLGFDF